MGPMRIERLYLADVTTPPSHPTPDKLIRVFGYLVWTPAALVLFDTGIGPTHDFIDEFYKPRRESLTELLAAFDASPRDVDVIVNCHLHFDHCGENQEFPGTRIVVQRRELDDAREPGYTVPEWIDFDGAAYEVVEDEHSISDGVYVLPTPGHTAGHQSLVLETSEGVVILAGQAADSSSGFEEGSGGWADGLDDAGAASIRKIKDMKPRRVLFAHDDEEWKPA
jgi:N-acyl homoserine lactone hydrolase